VSYWTERIKKKLDEVDAAVMEVRASINDTIAGAEGEATHWSTEAARLRADNEKLRARIASLLDVLRAARPEIEVDVATAREEGRAFHAKQIGDVLTRIDDALRGES